VQLQVQPDGRILFCAAINALDYLNLIPNRAVIGRLQADGTWDSEFTMVTCDLPLLQRTGPFWFNMLGTPGNFRPQLQPVPTVHLLQQTNGIIALAGAFDLVNQQSRRRLARLEQDGALRGQLILGLAGGLSPRLSIPPEVEAPYVIEDSADLTDWTAIRTNGYPWSPLDESMAPDSAIRFFRARSLIQP
jgi:hypothetical protein